MLQGKGASYLNLIKRKTYSIMKSVYVETPGSSAGLTIKDIEMPVPLDTELLVKIDYFALNRMDLLQRDGKYPVPQGASPILGVEFSGTVTKTCPSSNFQVNDKVFGLVSGGCYSEFVTINHTLAIALPFWMTPKDSSALPEVWTTAIQSLIFLNKFKKGDNVLVHAGASGVGTAAIQIARLMGAKKIIVTAGSQQKLDFCKSLGATTAINYKTDPDFAKIVYEATDGHGVDVILDFIGASYWNQNMESLAIDGSMTLQGFMGGAVVENLNLGVLLRKRISIHGSALRSRSLLYRVELRDYFVKELLPFFEDGTLKAVIDCEYSMSEIGEAHRHMESNNNIGKIVVKV